MVNLQTLEELRTRKEVEDYLKQLGKEITEEKLYALKQSYDKAQESSDALTMQQLDDVAGGLAFIVEVKAKNKVRTKRFGEYDFFVPYPGQDQNLILQHAEGKLGCPVIKECTILRIEPDGTISSINNTPTQDLSNLDLHFDLLKNSSGDDLAQIYITKSVIDPKQVVINEYSGGKLVLVPRSMIDDKNLYLLKYLAGFYDDISDGKQINLDAILPLNTEECSPEENDNIPKSSDCVIM